MAAGDMVAVNATMRGRHTGPLVFCTEQAEGRPGVRADRETVRHYAVPLLPHEDGKVAEHWANRDDLGMARQLGWIPPSPVYLLRCALLKRSNNNHKPKEI